MTTYPLYDPAQEHDACGVGAVVDIHGRASHQTVLDALTIVERLAHRAGCDATGTTGDGVGILTQIPHALYASELALGRKRDYGVGMLFLPAEEAAAQQAKADFDRAAADAGMSVIAWRDVPTRPDILGEGARAAMPRIRQVFVARPGDTEQGAAFDRKLYLLRRAYERMATGAYVCSLSSRTVVYKGMMLVPQLRLFYRDLTDERYQSALALVHSRFSTNTVPSWEKAHPHRMLMHNGEINTIRGNYDRMHAREETMRPAQPEMRAAVPVLAPDASDSMMLDGTLEFLYMNGMPLPRAMATLMPRAWRKDEQLAQSVRDFYHYQSTLMEPWDGPASVIFTDGDTVGAALDRNGLRPMRVTRTADRLVLSSETGVLPAPESARFTRLHAGELLAVDTVAGRVWSCKELLEAIACESPYGQWLQKGLMRLSELPRVACPAEEDPAAARRWAKAFGYSQEDMMDALRVMGETGKEPIASMGVDVPLAALSRVHPPLYDYFKQRFAQVTNPPIDALREQNVTDTTVYVGDDGNLLFDGPENCRVLELPSPVLTREELARVRALHGKDFSIRTISMLYAVEASLGDAVEAMLSACDAACGDGANLLILSDRGVSEALCAIPALLAVSALEQHLIRCKRRTAVSVIVESGEPRDAHQFALLIGYGARAVQPYLAQEQVAQMARDGLISVSPEKAVENYRRAVVDGAVHIASKMGVSTLQSYQSAQVFEAVGVNRDVIDRYFTNTPCRVGGVGLARIGADVLAHHRAAYAAPEDVTPDSVGFHKLRTGPGAEEHLYSPEVICLLQRAVRNDDQAAYDQYAALLEHPAHPRTLRDIVRIRAEGRVPVALSEVEPAEAIVRRFKTGAMSYGSISQEAHECLAQAMNRLGGKSNTGEGGEAPSRLGTERGSAIKQVASGRFGVTREYLRSAKEIQIKMAQGAKPGEGGHLPGAKVYPWIAQTRLSTPGVALISPPPHHDIYSIEDLAELIYDLRTVNPAARISVKLVAESGVGTIASGVAKAGAQVILISGYDGGTGAAPATSIHGAGLPWELGLAETHQTLCKNGLRGQVAIETDGKLMTGRDVAIAAMLGAEEFGFATAPLIAMGCRMMRKCHEDTCPFGIATQNPELRKRFAGKPEYVERLLLFVAEELRGIMASLGVRTLDELVGRADWLEPIEDAPLDVKPLIGFCANRHFEHAAPYDATDRKDVGASDGDVMAIQNTDRAFGAALPEHTGTVALTGCGGQSFGAFLGEGNTLRLTGVCNDYVGKGLSGGTLAVIPPEGFPAGDALIGNVALYGATSGRAYIAGTAGERFCVRNSGAWAVAEGVGDHGCEYMTGGRAVILGAVGQNFAAGMSGGVAYVLDQAGALRRSLNRELVLAEAVTRAEDIAELHGLLAAHLAATGSVRAKAVLSDWPARLPEFVKVIPREYKRITQEGGRA